MSIEDLLAHPRVWQGQAELFASEALATGFAELDDYLPGGGWPRGAVTEIFLERYGSGELSLLMPALAALSRKDAESKRWLVWIDPPFVPYAPALSDCGVELERVLLVHSNDRSDALWATEQAIRSCCSDVVLAWLKSAGDTDLRRLQLGAEEQQCWTVLFRPLSALEERSPASLRLKLIKRDIETRVEIIKCRGRHPEVIDLRVQ